MSTYVYDKKGFDFDSRIDPPYLAETPTDFEFILILRIHLLQMNPPKGRQTFMVPDFSGKQWPALRWNGASWALFKKRFLEQVLKVWDKAFVLIPPAKTDAFIWPAGGRRRNLLCRLRVKLLDTTDQAHAQIRVVRLAAPNESPFRSDSGMLDSGDVKPSRQRFAPEGATFEHNTVAHEVGHLLGLIWHSGQGDPQCTAEHNSACYGTNLIDRMNIMGAGSRLELEQARPWLGRIALHTDSTKRSDWTADWASTEAQLRGVHLLELDEAHKIPYKPVKPGLIDL